MRISRRSTSFATRTKAPSVFDSTHEVMDSLPSQVLCQKHFSLSFSDDRTDWGSTRVHEQASSKQRPAPERWRKGVHAFHSVVSIQSALVDTTFACRQQLTLNRDARMNICASGGSPELPT